MGRCSNNTGHKAKISKLRRDSTHLFDFFLDEAGASFTRVMMEAESGLEGILKGQTPSNSKGKSLLKKPNGKLYCPKGDDTFQIRVWPTRDSPKEQCLRLLFRWSDLYYMGYHCNESWYILEDEWEVTLPSQSQVKHRKNGIQFLPIEASYLGLNKYVTIGVFDLMKFYKTLMHSPAILDGDGDGDVLRYFDACQMALPAVVFSEALRNAIFRRWVFNELATTVGSTTPGTKVPRDFGIDFNHWADDSTKLFIENPAPHPKLISRLAIIKRRIFNKLPLLEPQYCSARAVAKVGKIHINIVVLGHIYSGKSTTAGHLIHKLGGIGKEAFENLEEEAAAMDRRSFKYAWIFDKLRAERERGITIDISLHKFETDKYCFSIIDAPGHQAFIKNMITGISQADCALLILDSTDGFEAGISKDGQTSEHIALSYALGVKQMICCCNKMDATTPKYSQARYQEVMNKTRPVLKKFHYNPDLIPFVPISGFEGENLVEGSLNLDWYKGPTLLQALDRINEPRWPWRLPLRLPLQDVYRIGGIGTISAGCIKTGVLTPSMEVSFTPTGLTSKVLSVEMHHEPISMALPGDRVGFIVEEALGNDLKRGHVASDAKDPAKEASSFTGRIIVLEHDDFQIRNGSVLFLHCHTAHTCVKISEILTKVDRKSGKLEDRFPRFLSGGQSGSVNMTATKPMVVEIFKKYPHLGCFALRNRQRVVAVGVIESVDG